MLWQNSIRKFSVAKRFHAYVAAPSLGTVFSGAPEYLEDW